ncbi:MAG: Rne/Rng family ribonuclease [Gammaproteobacteria bacterium]|nr:Rne/Rng family ribonuclease [Gammaproteobacteria bacterium]
MRCEILMNVGRYETRVALIENGVLQEIHLERLSKKELVGNIYKGKIGRIVPGMKAAFVDIGLEKAGFLHLSEHFPVKEGAEILVQVMKDPLGTKGARLTQQISIVSRYLVYMPGQLQIGLSTRIEDEVERQRLKTLLEKMIQTDQVGLVVRTAAEGVLFESLEKEYEFLNKLWQAIQKNAKKIKPKNRVYEDLSIGKKVIRDWVNASVEKIRVDDAVMFEDLQNFSKQFVPEAFEKLELTKSKAPIFERYGVEEELQRNLLRRVNLKSGGYLVIDQTEAMTTIDVNSGSFVGAPSHDETICKTNFEAAQMIARQLRLRNIGGIVVIDFIDMAQEEQRAQVLHIFHKALLQDHSRIKVSGFTEFGLVQLTRKRTHESLLRELCEPCLECSGRGMIKTVETLVYEIYRDLQREVLAFKPESGFLVCLSNCVYNGLMEEDPSLLAELESSLGLVIQLKSVPKYTREQYDIVPF